MPKNPNAARAIDATQSWLIVALFVFVAFTAMKNRKNSVQFSTEQLRF